MQSKNQNKRLYDMNESGSYMSVSHWTVRKLVNEGLIPYCRIGRKILIDCHDLDAFIEELKEKTK